MGDVDPRDFDAGTAVSMVLRELGDQMRDLRPAALADEPDAVHQQRTRVRRFRSLLAAFSPLFDDAPASVLRRWYRVFGAELGTVRDLEVRVLVAESALDEASEQGIIDDDEREAVHTRLVGAEQEAHRLAHARFVELQQLPRASVRGETLDAFLADPPLTPLAAEPARGVLHDLVIDEARRTLRRAERIGGEDDTEALHELRKAGRRLRYAAEAVSEEPVVLFDGRIKDLAEVGDDLHGVLGDHRDEVLFAEHVRRTAAHVAHEGGAALVFERLAEAADRRAAGHLDDLPHAVKRLRKLADD